MYEKIWGRPPFSGIFAQNPFKIEEFLGERGTHHPWLLACRSEYYP